MLFITKYKLIGIQNDRITKEYIIDAFDLKENTEKMILKGVVSRKKQLIPTLVSELQQ